MKIKLDWRAYFEEFCELHGKPVEANGRLLFQDGWTYSRTDLSGPEYPPPQDEKYLAELKRQYWEIRLRNATEERDEIERAYRRLSEMQEQRSATLKCKMRVFDDEKESYRFAAVDVNLPALESDLAFAQEEVEECQRHLTTVLAQSP